MVDVFQCDLASLASVSSAAASISSQYGQISCLILNAGCMLNDSSLTVDGNETTVASNHLGHFLLTHKLLPLLTSSSRVVTVGSREVREKGCVVSC